MCSSENIYFLNRKNNYEIHRCSDCGHGWVSSEVKDKDLTDFYASDEAKKMQYEFPEKVVRKDGKRFLKYIETGYPQKGTLLDVGCGRGIYVEVAKEYGWKGVGFDFSSESRKSCQERQVPFYESWDALERDCGQHFADQISLWEVLEHLRDPLEMLVGLKSFLKPDGILSLSTPNYDSSLARQDEKNWMELRPPMHLHYFTPKSLAALLNKAGYQGVFIKTYGAWNKGIEKMGAGFQTIFNLSGQNAFLLKVASYKIGKFYFDRTLQRQRQGLGLFAVASEPQNFSKVKFREFF